MVDDGHLLSMVPARDRDASGLALGSLVEAIGKVVHVPGPTQIMHPGFFKDFCSRASSARNL